MGIVLAMRLASRKGEHVVNLAPNDAYYQASLSFFALFAASINEFCCQSIEGQPEKSAPREEPSKNDAYANKLTTKNFDFTLEVNPEERRDRGFASKIIDSLLDWIHFATKSPTLRSAGLVFASRRPLQA